MITHAASQPPAGDSTDAGPARADGRRVLSPRQTGGGRRGTQGSPYYGNRARPCGRSAVTITAIPSAAAVHVPLRPANNKAQDGAKPGSQFR
jgi:hypothetical protein